jgi:osmoprotectant transport system substrate-binding protein
MRTVARAVLGLALGLATVGLATGCGKTGSSTTAASAGCAPLAGKQLVMLTDDKNLQVVDNVIPAINAKASNDTVIAALNKVSSVVGQKELVSLNKATDVDRLTSKAAAEDFASRVKLSDGVAKGPGGKITIGAATNSERQTLGELYRIVLDAAGYDATVEQSGTRDQYEPALEKGDIQVVPEAAGSLAEFLNKKINGASAPAVATGDLDKTVNSLKDLGSKVGLTFGMPSTAANANSFGVTKALADKYGISTLSDFAAKCSGKATVLGGPADCPRAAYCQLGLEKTYGVKFGKFTGLDAGGPKTKSALTGGTITVGLLFSSDSVYAQPGAAS